MKNVTYIFAGNRKGKYLNDNYQAKDFFYGLFAFDRYKYNVKIIEMEDYTGFLNIFLRVIDKIFQKIFNLPFYFSKLTTVQNFKILRNSQYVILVNESVGCSALLLLIILKLFGNISSSLFVMGLYSKKLKYEKLRKLHNLIIKFLILFVDNVFFLGKGELDKAKKIHKNSTKLIYFPFCIDTKFWHKDIEYMETKFSNDIIFVGNDGNRDIRTLINIAKNTPELDYIFVSDNELLKNLQLANVKIYNGSWANSLLTDLELKALYEASKLTIIPLKNSTQPSGQSVTLQSMAVGTPVMITKTDGFWDIEKFIDNKDLFFVSDNDVDLWKEKITTVLSNNKLMSDVSLNAKEKILNNYNLDKFYEKLFKDIHI